MLAGEYEVGERAMPEVHITSYFSVDTDLANQMHFWAEFRSGAGYWVELATPDQTQAVSIPLVERTVDESAYVRITASAPGPLFDRVSRSRHLRPRRAQRQSRH
jgi:hypothetical protein